VVQVDLPTLLGVDLVHCETAAKRAMAAAEGELQLVQSELCIAAYFEGLAAEVEELLQVGLSCTQNRFQRS
jgi:E3 UFM1-protein ligase 1